MAILTRILRLTLVLMALVFPTALRADDTPPVAQAAWQLAITGQIEAFRQHDASGALKYAGAVFQQSYRDPDVFYKDIARMGYLPILNSTSHSFGEFQMPTPTSAQQIVRLIGPDHQLYEALYQMENEPDGWRVRSVMLRKRPGIAI